MSSADPWPDAEVEPVWYRIDLDRVAELVDEDAEHLWRHSPWYCAVDWTQVAGIVDDVLQRHCSGGVVDRDLEHLLAPLQHTLSTTDYQGVQALTGGWAICITRWQLHEGGHRTAAMRAQGVRFVPGRCLRIDVGSGVDANQLYPIQSPAS